MGKLDYSEIVKNALKGVLREVLTTTQNEGLPEPHHFYISFDTKHPEVLISKKLLMLYPEEMQIVIQHQYWDLEVKETYFRITLSFNGVKEELTIPFSSIKNFSDPYAEFSLQFDNNSKHSAKDLNSNDKIKYTSDNIEKEEEEEEKNDNRGNDKNVITLDSFRKK